jgi:DNA-binding SARP family transcriptional activator
VQFLILGPLEVRRDGTPLRVGGPQQQAVLALLLAHPNQVVSADRLADQLWRGRPPPKARSLLQGCVAALRRSDVALVTQAPGYLLRVPAGALDAQRFEDLARDAEQQADPARASALFREALALWRGPAFDGLAIEACQAEAARLAERRMSVLQRCLDAESRQGRDVVAELQTLVREHPLRESLWVRLMTALQREGRQADALAAYRELRRHLVEELGVEPGAAARALHQEILAGTAPVPPKVNAGPAQVPAAVQAFTGRDEHLDILDGLTPGIAVICGMAGVGKTTLAVEWAHRHRDDFADGQLYVDLRGFSTAGPLEPAAALAGFLQALGVPTEQVPAEIDQAAALYRTLLSRRAVLVVLDNAVSAAQVRPLLPGGAGCRTLVTSRSALGGLVARNGAHHLALDALTPEEAVALLVRVLGTARTAGENVAVEALGRLCAYLPLALRIAAANLTLRPKMPLVEYVEELGSGSRLSALAVADDDDSAVRAAFDLSYSALPEPARRLFRLLAAAPGTDFTIDDAAALTGTDRPAAATTTNTLVDAHLIIPLAAGRHTFHDLLRLYAADCSPARDREPERRKAVTRLYDHYLDRSGQAAHVLYPHMLRILPAGTTPDGLDHAAARQWLDAERHNLVRAVTAAADHGLRKAGWLLADTLRGYFHLSRHTADWLACAEAALRGARLDGDLRGQAAAMHSLGTAYRSIGEHHHALSHYEDALRLAQAAGWRESEATTLGNLGIVCRKLGRLDAAAAHLRAALLVDREAGRRAGPAKAARPRWPPRRRRRGALTLGRLIRHGDLFVPNADAP